MSESYEIHSILEFGDTPASGLWWVLSPAGESPPVRAGTDCLIRKSPKHPSMDGSIIVSGGGTPQGYIDDVTELSLFHGTWKKLATKGFTPRYEHVMVEVDEKLVVLLGSGDVDPTIQVLTDSEWSKTTLNGSMPAPRTVSQTARFDNKTYIWSGGSPKGLISDINVYVIENDSVKREKISGELPPPLQEFAMCADDTYLYLHGGMSNDGKTNDLYRVNRRTFRSKRCQIKGDLSARAMHKMVQFNQDLYLFGGLLENDEVCDQLYRLRPAANTSTYTVERIDFETRPTPRLAFNFSIVNMPVKSRLPDSTAPVDSNPSDDPVITPIDDWKVTIDGQNIPIDDLHVSNTDDIDYSSYHPVPLLFIHGGCDAQGEFFNDIYVSTIPN